MKLIDADALIAEILPPEDAPNDVAKLILSVFIEAVKSFPAVDAVEVRHGRWEWAYLDHEAFGVRPKVNYCSVCHQTVGFRTFYCPNCGAKMDGEDGDGDEKGR